VAKYLECNIEDAELWIVNLVRSENIEAKIDSEKGVVVIIKNPKTFLANITGKLKELIPKTNLLASNVKRLLTSDKK